MRVAPARDLRQLHRSHEWVGRKQAGPDFKMTHPRPQAWRSCNLHRNGHAARALPLSASIAPSPQLEARFNPRLARARRGGIRAMRMRHVAGWAARLRKVLSGRVGHSAASWACRRRTENACWDPPTKAAMCATWPSRAGHIRAGHIRAGTDLAEPGQVLCRLPCGLSRSVRKAHTSSRRIIVTTCTAVGFHPKAPL